MRPTVGQILSGLAVGAVATSMLVMPERFIGAEDAAIPGLVLQAPAERIVVRAAPIRPRRAHRAMPIKRRVIVVERRAAVAIAISHRTPVRPRTAPPPSRVARKVVAQRPPLRVAAVPRPVEPPAVEAARVSYKKDKAKGEKREEEKRKKWRDDEDENDEDRRHRDEDRGDRDEDRHDRDEDRHDDDDKHSDDDD